VRAIDDPHTAFAQGLEDFVGAEMTAFQGHDLRQV
jgi:hypothetical protein